MKKEELLSIINTVFTHFLGEITYKETRAKYEQAYSEIVAILKKEVTEEWIQEKTIDMIEIVSKGEILEAMSFIRKLVGELSSG